MCSDYSLLNVLISNVSRGGNGSRDVEIMGIRMKCWTGNEWELK